MTETITWLHISDTHFCKRKHSWESEEVYESFYIDLIKMKEEHNLYPDLIFFTGDVALGHYGNSSGLSLKDQYKEAKEFIERILKIFPKLLVSNIFIVPGNHDVNRTLILKSQTEWLEKLRKNNLKNGSIIVNELINANCFEWKTYMERLRDYKSFLEDSGYEHLLEDPDRLIYSVKRHINGFEIGIAGLNSAWSSCVDDKGKLWIGTYQVAETRKKLKDAMISIVISHHPPNWFTEHEEIPILRKIERDFNFYLHGHEHGEWVTPISKHIRISSGALYNGLGRQNGYNFVRLYPTQKRGQVFLRIYDKDNGTWIPHIIGNKTNNDGIWSFDISLKTEKILIGIGKDASEDSLEEIFDIASRSGSNVKFLRLAGPSKFRNEVVEFLLNKENKYYNKDQNKAYCLLTDKRIREIQFILTNPYSESFLTRMDFEDKDNWSIWGVRNKVFYYIEGLSYINNHQGKNRIKVFHHSTDLVWNLSIAGDTHVAARGYYKSSTGHDEKVAEILLENGQDSRLAESFISYFNLIKNDPRTCIVCSKTKFDSMGSWPSLYKGNAIYCPELRQDLINKICSSEHCEKAERKWLSSCTKFKKELLSRVENENELLKYFKYFNPVALEDEYEFESYLMPGKMSLSIKKIKGILASELLWHIQKAGCKYEKDKEFQYKLEIISGSIVFQAYSALAQFHKVGESILDDPFELKPYPWVDNLKRAFEETKRFFSGNCYNFNKCVGEVLKICSFLEKYIEDHRDNTQPFRDAHLKNRIIKIDPNDIDPKELDLDNKDNNYKSFYNFFIQRSSQEIFYWLKENTFDIDFETGLWQVTKWDDPLHIFWTNNLGIKHLDQLNNGLELLKELWRIPEDGIERQIFWITLLCRSLREYCRRVWYSHVMPSTYHKRYKIEQRNHFLNLAIVAIEKIALLPQANIEILHDDIKNFLLDCLRNTNNIWNHAISPNDDCKEIINPNVSGVKRML